jgi:hypothetical protein
MPACFAARDLLHFDFLWLFLVDSGAGRVDDIRIHKTLPFVGGPSSRDQGVRHG